MVVFIANVTMMIVLVVDGLGIARVDIERFSVHRFDVIWFFIVGFIVAGSVVVNFALVWLVAVRFTRTIYI